MLRRSIRVLSAVAAALAIAIGLDSCVILENSGTVSCGLSLASANGGPCRCDADCVDDLAECWSEEVTGIPQGMCSRFCNSNEECGAGFLCESDHCFPSCKSDADCAVGRYCDGSTEPVQPICFVLCSTDADCQGGHCNPYSTRCDTTPSASNGKKTGAACSTNSECLSALCVGGNCTTQCDPANDRCPDETRCDEWACRRPCTNDIDCEGVGLEFCSKSALSGSCL